LAEADGVLVVLDGSCPLTREDREVLAGNRQRPCLVAINKADLPGVENTERALRTNLELGYNGSFVQKAGHKQKSEAGAEENPGWKPPILKTVATEDRGIARVADAISEHYGYLKESGQLQELERKRLRREIDSLLQSRLITDWREKAGERKMEEALQKVAGRQWSPDQAVDWLIKQSF
jgi:LAO/AO transport system kinase